jgi:hypothetical protein
MDDLREAVKGFRRCEKWDQEGDEIEEGGP